MRHDAAQRQRIRRFVDHGCEGRPIRPDQRVAKVDGDRGDRDGSAHDQRATLDGQMSRNGQYVQARVPGFGV